MATYLGQDIKMTYWLPESSFGVTPAVGSEANLYYLGEVKDFVSDENDNPEEDEFEDRAFTEVNRGPYEYGFQSVQVLTELIRGNSDIIPDSKYIDIPPRKITADNVDEFWEDLRAKTGQ